MHQMTGATVSILNHLKQINKNGAQSTVFICILLHMNKLIEKQLEKVLIADLSNHDELKHEFNIKKRVDIQLKLNTCYIIHLTEKLFNNEVLCVNWNGNKMPTVMDLEVDVDKIMAKMIHVVAIGYDPDKQTETDYRWRGWLSINDIEVIKELE